MGNSFGCSASGERLVSAARDGDLVEAKMLLDCNPCLAKYSTFGGLNSPLHFAAAKGHNEIVALLLENGADVNSRNYCGQQGNPVTTMAYNLENVGCSPQQPPWMMLTLVQSALKEYVVLLLKLLLDLHANVSAVTFHYGTSMDLIGAGSTPLHYAACGGNLKCCQARLRSNILLARGASRLTLNCNGWLPLDVARMWGRHWLEPLLAPNSDTTIPRFPSSNYLSLPLSSVLNIACGHELCVRCALYLCSTSHIPSNIVAPPGSIPCPLCRHGILSFVKLPISPVKENRLHVSLGLCTPCMLHPCDADCPSPASEIRNNRVASVSSDIFCPVTCSPFPSVAIPLCTCNDGPCPSFESGETEMQDGSPRRSQSTSIEQDKIEGPRLERTTCSNMFWGRRSCSREHQCNSEINA
ncbi:hypothetical protein GOBAR_DD01512 [Gossypium barbadense]|nr:hypothetical protein GOBAR_DD01512 [Gossypium barbadense]